MSQFTPIATSPLVAFPSAGDKSRVYFVDTSNDIIELAWTGSAWSATDVTIRATALSAITNTGLAGFVVNKDQPRVYFIDTSNSITELAWTGSGWSSSSITAASGTTSIPKTNSPLLGLVFHGSESRVYFVDTTNNVIELAWTGSGWSSSNITQVANAATLPASTISLAGFVVNGDQPRVYYIDTNEDVVELAWTSKKSWVYNNITDATGAKHAEAGSALTGFFVNGNQSRVYFTDEGNDILELAWTGSSWSSSNITHKSQAPSVSTNNALAGFALHNDQSRVYSIGSVTPSSAATSTNSKLHVEELAWLDNSWSSQDITSASGASSVAANSALAGFAIDGSQPRIYYFNNQTSIIELAWNNHNWTSSALPT